MAEKKNASEASTHLKDPKASKTGSAKSAAAAGGKTKKK